MGVQSSSFGILYRFWFGLEVFFQKHVSLDHRVYEFFIIGKFLEISVNMLLFESKRLKLASFFFEILKNFKTS